tara:strand:+ start:50 stop:280 length:231 start_codon:yes stop_codon:yes gene_type:complete
MKLIKRTKLQYFIDVNGMDVLSTRSIETVVVVDKIEYIGLLEAQDYIANSYFGFMWKSLAEFCGTITWNEEEFKTI